MKVAKLLAFAAVLGMVSMAMAADKKPPKEKGKRVPSIRGKILEINGANLVIGKRTRGSKDVEKVTVATNAETKVTLDRKEATVAELKVDMYVSITPENASETVPAAKIMAMSKMPERKPRPKPE